MNYKAEIALTRNDICEIIAKYFGVEKEDVKIGLAFTADNGDKDLAGKVYKDIMIPDNPSHADPIVIPVKEPYPWIDPYNPAIYASKTIKVGDFKNAQEVTEAWNKAFEYLKGKKDEQNT